MPLETGGWGKWSTEFSTKLGADPAYRYLVVDRSGPPAPTQGAMLDVVWTRNLTVVDIKKFTVVNQDDPDGGDEVKIFWHLGDASDDPWPAAPDDATANGAWPTQMTYYYDGLASGASSKHPQIECATWCPLAPSLADSHHIVLAYPQTLWGFAWEIDDTSPDDPLFHEGLSSDDGRFRITALDPDPWQWIGEGDVNTWCRTRRTCGPTSSGTRTAIAWWPSATACSSADGGDRRGQCTVRVRRADDRGAGVAGAAALGAAGAAGSAPPSNARSSAGEVGSAPSVPVRIDAARSRLAACSARILASMVPSAIRR